MISLGMLSNFISNFILDPWHSHLGCWTILFPISFQILWDFIWDAGNFIWDFIGDTGQFHSRSLAVSFGISLGMLATSFGISFRMQAISLPISVICLADFITDFMAFPFLMIYNMGIV